MADPPRRTWLLIEQEINQSMDMGNLHRKKAPLEDQCEDYKHPRDVDLDGTSVEADPEANPS